jgi:hypothetical protein
LIICAALVWASGQPTPLNSISSAVTEVISPVTGGLSVFLWRKASINLLVWSSIFILSSFQPPSMALILEAFACQNIAGLHCDVGWWKIQHTKFH